MLVSRLLESTIRVGTLKVIEAIASTPKQAA